MSNREFENYIALIGKLLQLSDKQRDQIAGELQDHLQMRVADLESEGIEKQDAIKRALEEFGDAAVMAKNFQSVINHKKRRWMMRFVTFSIAGSFVAAVLLMAMWPGDSRFGAPSKSIAQDNQAVEKTKPKADPDLHFSIGTERTIKAEQALKQNVDLLFDETPFSDVEYRLEEMTGLNFILSQSAQDDSLSEDEPITFELNDVPLNKALSLMLRTKNASYVIDDGIVVIISRDDAEDSRWFRLKMYDCRDLVAVLPKSAPEFFGGGLGGGGFEGGAGGGGAFSVPSAPQGLPLPAQGNNNGGQPSDDTTNVSALLDQKLTEILFQIRANVAADRPEPTGELTLVNLVQSMVGPDSWQDTGQGLGVIDAVNGVLVVTQSEDIQQQIEKFLADLEVSVLRRSRIEVGAASVPKKLRSKPVAKGKEQANQPSELLPHESDPFSSSTDPDDDPFK